MDEEKYGKVIDHKSDLYTTYDVTDKHYCINIRPRKTMDIFRDVQKELHSKFPDLMNDCDYFSPPGAWELKNDLQSEFWPKHHWVVVHYVKGGSEGYYVHVAVTSNGRYLCLFLAKTLLEGGAGITWAEKMVCALSRIMEV